MPTAREKKGYLCVFSCVSAARHCVWTSSHRTSSCKQKVAPLNASAGVLAGVMSFHILSHSLRCDRCAASSSPCWNPWETQVWTLSILFITNAVMRICIYAHTFIRAWTFGQANSPPSWLLTVGASACHSAQPLALLAQLIFLIHQPDMKVGQVTCVQGGVAA